jgi:hypothetical protein
MDISEWSELGAKKAETMTIMVLENLIAVARIALCRLGKLQGERACGLVHTKHHFIFFSFFFNGGGGISYH